MELKIYSPTEDGFVKEITWNHEEIKDNESNATLPDAQHRKGNALP